MRKRTEAFCQRTEVLCNMTAAFSRGTMGLPPKCPPGARGPPWPMLLNVIGSPASHHQTSGPGLAPGWPLVPGHWSLDIENQARHRGIIGQPFGRASWLSFHWPPGHVVTWALLTYSPGHLSFVTGHRCVGEGWTQNNVNNCLGRV